MNLFQIEKRFRNLEEKEKQVRYFYDPRTRPIRGLKKHRFIHDLAIDMKRDQQLYGFDPFLPDKSKEEMVPLQRIHQNEEEHSISLERLMKQSDNLYDDTQSKDSKHFRTEKKYAHNHMSKTNDEEFIRHAKNQFQLKRDSFPGWVLSSKIKLLHQPRIRNFAALQEIKFKDKSRPRTRGPNTTQTHRKRVQPRTTLYTRQDMFRNYAHLNRISLTRQNLPSANTTTDFQNMEEAQYNYFPGEEQFSSREQEEKYVTIDQSSIISSPRAVTAANKEKKDEQVLTTERSVCISNFYETSTMLLDINQYRNENFFKLIFPLGDSAEEKDNLCIRIIDITSGGFPFVFYDSIQIDKENYLCFSEMKSHIFNPFEKFPWIKSFEDIIGNTIKFEIYNDSELLMSKFVFFDYFSYENYFIVLLEIANHSREEQKLTKTHENIAIIETNESPRPVDMLNYFIKNNAIQEQNPKSNHSYFVLNAQSSSAFRYLLHRYRQLKGEEGYSEFENNIHTLFNTQKKIVIRGNTIIEFKNAIVKALDVDKFQLLKGDVSYFETDTVFQFLTHEDNVIQIIKKSERGNLQSKDMFSSWVDSIKNTIQSKGDSSQTGSIPPSQRSSFNTKNTQITVPTQINKKTIIYARNPIQMSKPIPPLQPTPHFGIKRPITTEAFKSGQTSQCSNYITGKSGKTSINKENPIIANHKKSVIKGRSLFPKIDKNSKVLITSDKTTKRTTLFSKLKFDEEKKSSISKYLEETPVDSPENSSEFEYDDLNIVGYGLQKFQISQS